MTEAGSGPEHVPSHQAQKLPDWLTPEGELVPNATVLQKCAYHTNGWGSFPNIMSAVGAVVAVDGVRRFAQGDLMAGTIEMGAGRAVDALDGVAALRWGLRSLKGELVDASLDKAVMAAALAILIASGTIPSAAAVWMVGHNGVNIVASGVAKSRGIEIHPDIDGKHSTFAEWIATGSYMLAAATAERYHLVSTGFMIVGWAAVAWSIKDGIPSSRSYVRTAFGSRQVTEQA